MTFSGLISIKCQNARTGFIMLVIWRLGPLTSKWGQNKSPLVCHRWVNASCKWFMLIFITKTTSLYYVIMLSDGSRKKVASLVKTDQPDLTCKQHPESVVVLIKSASSIPGVRHETTSSKSSLKSRTKSNFMTDIDSVVLQYVSRGETSVNTANLERNDKKLCHDASVTMSQKRKKIRLISNVSEPIISAAVNSSSQNTTANSPDNSGSQRRTACSGLWNAMNSGRWTWYQ